MFTHNVYIYIYKYVIYIIYILYVIHIVNDNESPPSGGHGIMVIVNLTPPKVPPETKSGLNKTLSRETNEFS